ncbi:MAG: helix-turn-helix domain-containing protein [Pseudomonadota bacterium]
MSFQFDLDLSVDECPVEFAVAMIGGKWKPVLLFHLMMGAKRYSELQRLVSRVSDRMLTRSLRELEADGLVHREVFPEVPVRVEYSLTTDGKTLYPILAEMSRWGTKRQKA